MKKSHEEINDVLAKRDHSCGLMGPGYFYKSPPYAHQIYKSGAEFETKVPFKLRKDCKRATTGVSRDKDKLKSYFVEPHNKLMCQSVRGFWDPKAVSRSNKFMRGVCFTNKQDMHCSKHSVPELIYREEMKDRDKRIAQASSVCNADDQCSWVKSRGQPYDCVRKGALEMKTVVDKPPASMPADATKGQTEQFLYDWYVGKKHGPAPPVGELFGEGDRCNVVDAVTVTKSQTGTVTDEDKLKALGYDVSFFKKWQKTDKVAYEQSIATIRKEYDMFVEDEEYNMDNPPSASAPVLTIVQSVVNMFMKNLATKETTNRGIMAIHSTGSGKTCCATGVFDAFWDTKMQIVFASSLDAIASNPDTKFHDCAKRFFPRFQKMGNIAGAFAERHITFLPFAKLANRIEKTEKLKQMLKAVKSKKSKADGTTKQSRQSNKTSLVDHIHDTYNVDKIHIVNALSQCNIRGFEDYVDLDNCCLIVDEVHNLFRPLATQKAKHAIVEKHIVDPKKHPKLKVVILTATPGDNITDIIKLINIVRDPTHEPIKMPDVDSVDSMNKFKDSVRGLISYLDMSSDTTKFPTVHDEGPIKYPMSTAQFEKYVESYKSIKSGNTNYKQLAKDNQLNKYWSGARKYSNMLYKFEQGMKLTEFSSKLPALLETIAKYPAEKHYVYSSFYDARGSGQGILEIARQLEKQGYKKLTLADAKKSATLPKGKRYILAIQKELGDEGTATAGRNLNALIDVYNKSANKNGEYVHVFLASQSFNEGIDLRGVKHIHFFEPLITMASDLQTIGRARRYCSHSDLDRSKGEWSIKLHRYLSDFPSDSKNKVTNELSNEKLQAELDALTEQLAEIKGMRAKALQEKYGDAKYRDILKGKIEELKIKLPAKTKKKGKAIDASDVKMIDEFIYKESMEKFKELFVIHQAIKEVAVDCKLLKTFHGTKC
jgi:hypothetical protein